MSERARERERERKRERERERERETQIAQYRIINMPTGSTAEEEEDEALIPTLRINGRTDTSSNCSTTGDLHSS